MKRVIAVVMALVMTLSYPIKIIVKRKYMYYNVIMGCICENRE